MTKAIAHANTVVLVISAPLAERLAAALDQCANEHDGPYSDTRDLMRSVRDKLEDAVRNTEWSNS